MSQYITFLKNQSEKCTAFNQNDRPTFRKLADILFQEWVYSNS